MPLSPPSPPPRAPAPRSRLAELQRRLRLTLAYLGHRVEGRVGPEALLIETTVRCNLRCPMCPRTGAGLPAADLPDELLWPLLDDFAALGGEHVYLYGLGEPLLDPRLTRIVARARQLGLTTIVSTNATLLDDERIERLLDAGIDHLIASLDAASPETYARFRTGGDYETTVAGVRRLAARKVARQDRTELVVQFVRLRGNLHEQDAFRALWEGVPGVDHVRLKDEDIGLPDHNLYDRDGFRRRNPCHVLWRGPLVARYDGRVYACYNFAGEGIALGSLRDHDLATLWRSPELQALRQAHLDHSLAPDSICGRCPAVRPRLPFILGAIALGGRRTRRLIPLAEKAALRVPVLLQEPRRPVEESDG